MSELLEKILPSVIPRDAGVRLVSVSREMYHFIGMSGHLKDELRYELFDGCILEEKTQKAPYPSLTMKFTFALAALFGKKCVRCRMPVVLANDTELQPDISVIAQRDNDFAPVDNPSAAETQLVVEVSVSTLEFDAGAKAVRYAQSGIPECWVLDVVGRALIVHRDPTETGYADVTRLAETESISPLAAPQATLNIADFLP